MNSKVVKLIFITCLSTTKCTNLDSSNSVPSLNFDELSSNISVYYEEFIDVYSIEIEVKPGDGLPLSAVREQPMLQWETNPDSFNTVVMIEFCKPYPESDEITQTLLWLVGNIPSDDVDSGEVIWDYTSPTPDQESNSLYHYFLLTYQQIGPIDFDCSAISNKDFSVKEFTKKYKLRGPSAGTFFKVQYEKYC